MPKPGEHKTVQARILAYAQESGWTSVPRAEAERRRGFDAAASTPEGRARPATLPFAARRPYRASSNMKTKNQSIMNEGTLKLVYDTPFGDLTSYTGFAHRSTRQSYDFDGTYTRGFEVLSAPWGQDTFQQTLDYAIDTNDRLNLVVGASYYNDTTNNNGSQALFFGFPFSQTFAKLKAEAWAVYFDANYQLTDKLYVGVGGRYTSEDKSITNSALGFFPIPEASADASFSDFIPRATVRYELAPDTNIYASYSEGFRSGGFNPTPVNDATRSLAYRPENITAYEVGFKTAQSIYRFEASAYYYDYTDLQVGVTRSSPTGLISYVSNAPSAEIYGLDLQGSVEPIENLTLSAGLSLLHARYKEFPGITGVGLDPVTNLDVESVQDWSGLQMTRAPDVSGNVSADYRMQLAGGELRFTANASYTDSAPQSNPSVYGDLAGPLARVQRYKNPSYSLVNGQIAWTDPSEHYTFTVYGTNLTDEQYYINYGGTTLYGDVGVFNQPRSLGVKFNYKY